MINMIKKTLKYENKKALKNAFNKYMIFKIYFKFKNGVVNNFKIFNKII